MGGHYPENERNILAECLIEKGEKEIAFRRLLMEAESMLAIMLHAHYKNDDDMMNNFRAWKEAKDNI